MRNALFTTHVPLHPYPTYHEVYGFYETAVEWRDWVRKKLATLGDAALEDRYPVVNEYREVLRAYGDEVIELLQEHLEDSSLAYERPELPQLPG